MILMPLTSRHGISAVAFMTSSGSLVAMSPQAPYDGLAREPQRSLSVPALLAEPHQLGRGIDCLSEVRQQIFC